MVNYYIHQIGNMNDKVTSDRLMSILKSRMICSRDYMEKIGIKHNYDHSSFKLNISEDKKLIYYDDGIHKDRVSLSDPENHHIKNSIKMKDAGNITCFNYNYVAFAVSRDVPIVPKEQTKGLAPGEVQVFKKIDSEYIVGLILPFSKEQLSNETVKSIVEKIYELCERENWPLDIYNYEGELLKSKETKRSK